jgi:anti-sigma factor RsiW
MCDDSLINIVSGADAADEEDILLRASLVAALCELYSDKSAAAEPGTVSENAGERPIDDSEYDGALRPIPFSRHRTALSRLHYGWVIAASLAAVVVFGAGVVWGGKGPTERGDLIEEVADYHEVYSRETTHLVEVPASQIDQLTAWLGERLKHDVKVPDLTDAGLHFVGGSMLVVNDRPVAELVYSRAEGRPIAICISRIDGKPWSMAVEQHEALRIATWGKDAYAYLVLGELDDTAVRDLARRVEAQI